MSSSNVGNAQTYEAGDQRNPPDSEKEENNQTRQEEGMSKKGAHDSDDPKDERSIANRLDAAKPQNDDAGESGKATAEDKMVQDDPLSLARSHGNEPSRGAKVDASIMEDEEEELRKKDEAKAQSKAAKKGKH